MRVTQEDEHTPGYSLLPFLPLFDQIRETEWYNHSLVIAPPVILAQKAVLCFLDGMGSVTVWFDHGSNDNNYRRSDFDRPGMTTPKAGAVVECRRFGLLERLLFPFSQRRIGQ
jgi:hypothetical protein